jgi:hypothetical protein
MKKYKYGDLFLKGHLVGVAVNEREGTWAVSGEDLFTTENFTHKKTPLVDWGNPKVVLNIAHLLTSKVDRKRLARAISEFESDR